MKVKHQSIFKFLPLLIVVLLFIPNLVSGQDWCKKANLPSANRMGPAGFSIGDRGYVCFGETNANTNQLWEFDPEADSWTRKTNFPGNRRNDGAAFVINDTAYVGIGWDGIDTFNTMYAYTQITDSWKRVASYPGNGAQGSFGVAVNGFGYVGGGSDGLNAKNDFWKYDPIANQWTSLGILPFGSRAGMVAEVINGRIYLGMGYNGSKDFNDFWEYDPSTNRWRQRADCPGLSRLDAAAFVVNNAMIVGSGYRLNGNTQGDYYQYNPNTNIWKSISGFSDGARSLSAAFTIANKGYLSCGLISKTVKTSNTWEYDPNKSFVIDTMICFGDSFVYKKDKPNGNYLWFDSATDSVRAFTEEGQYFVDYDFGGCLYTDTINVEIIHPKVDLGLDTFLCPMERRQLSAYNVDATYLWQDGSTLSTFLVDTAGTYFVEVNLKGCLVYDTITFTSRPNPKVELISDTLLCPGDTLLLDATTKDATYGWQDGSTDSSIRVSQEGIYFVNVTVNGCDTTVFTNIRTQENLKPFFSDSMVICNDKEVTLSANSPYPATYLWNDSTTDNSLKVSDSAIYWVEISTFCDTLRDSIDVQLKDCSDSCNLDESSIPNVFSPNGDGVNDYFFFDMNCPTSQFDFRIYDRWGDLVFISNFSRIRWDGRINGKKAHAGNFYFIIRYKLLGSNELISKKGSISLFY